MIRRHFLNTVGFIPSVSGVTSKLTPNILYPLNIWHKARLLHRPTYLSADIGFTAILSFFVSYTFPELTKQNSTKTGHMLRSSEHMDGFGSVNTIWKCMSEIWVPPPTKRGQKPLFSTISQLNGNFNGLYLRNETRYTQSASAMTSTRSLETSSQNIIICGPQTA